MGRLYETEKEGGEHCWREGSGGRGLRARLLGEAGRSTSQAQAKRRVSGCITCHASSPPARTAARPCFLSSLASALFSSVLAVRRVPQQPARWPAHTRALARHHPLRSLRPRRRSRGLMSPQRVPSPSRSKTLRPTIRLRPAHPQAKSTQRTRKTREISAVSLSPFRQTTSSRVRSLRFSAQTTCKPSSTRTSTGMRQWSSLLN